MDRITTAKWGIFSIFVLSLGVVWIWVSAIPQGNATQEEVFAPQEGFLAPIFTLQTFNGDEFTLSDYRGSPVVINFWTSWCPPCKSEMPTIQKIYDEFSDQGLVVLAVNSTHQDNLGDAITFAQIQKLSFPILLDKDGSASRTYDVRSLPTTFFISRNGRIKEVIVGGPMSEALLRIRVEELLEGGK